MITLLVIGTVISSVAWLVTFVLLVQSELYRAEANRFICHYRKLVKDNRHILGPEFTKQADLIWKQAVEVLS